MSCCLVALMAASLWPGVGSAQTTSPLFDRGRVGVEFGVGVLTEAWNLNNTRETVTEATMAVWWAFADRANLTVEMHASRVFQADTRNAFLTGVVPIFRIKTVATGRWQTFVEAGLGATYADTIVPARGTRFNYLAILGLGFSKAVSDQTSITTGARWWHLSNNSLNGRDHNPDIQGLGGFVAVTVGFR